MLWNRLSINLKNLPSLQFFKKLTFRPKYNTNVRTVFYVVYDNQAHFGNVLCGKHTCFIELNIDY